VRRTTKRLTIAAIVTASIVLVPAAVLAATGTFTSTSFTPAVRGANSSTLPGATAIAGDATGPGTATHYGITGFGSGAKGIGIAGTGKQYGVLSNGPLGVSAGNQLVCTGCVNEKDLGTLPAGQSESGLYAAGGDASGGYLAVAINFTIPLSQGIAQNHVYDVSYEGASGHCPGAGHAAPGWLCLYGQVGDYQVEWVDDAYTSPAYNLGSPDPGVIIYWDTTGTEPYVGGSWTVTAP
jgi:hypothetical protein